MDGFPLRHRHRFAGGAAAGGWMALPDRDRGLGVSAACRTRYAPPRGTAFHVILPRLPRWLHKLGRLCTMTHET